MAGQLLVTRNGLQVLGPTYWNAWYANARKEQDPAKSAWGNPTALMVEKITGAVGAFRTEGDKPGRKFVVDLGAGDGRYSVWAAKQGAIVDHVDSSVGACKGLTDMAAAHGARNDEERGRLRVKEGAVAQIIPPELVLCFDDTGGRIHVHTMDVAQYARRVLGQTPDLIDVVISSGLMEYLDPHGVAFMLRTLQTHTKVGGVHAIVYLAQGPGVSKIPGEHPHVPGFVEGCYEAGWKQTFTTDTGRPNDEIRDDTHVIIRAEDGIDALIQGEPTTHRHMIRRFMMMKDDPNMRK